MTPEDVRKRVEEWEATLEHGDNESAHIAEDAWLEIVLSAIADGTATDPAGCAREALRMCQADYERWYA